MKRQNNEQKINNIWNNDILKDKQNEIIANNDENTEEKNEEEINKVNNESLVPSSTKIINLKIEKKNNSNYNNKEVEENHIDKDIGKEELKSSKDNSYLSLLREKILYKQSELNQNKENEDNKKIKEDIIERNEEKIKQFDLKERKIEKRRKKENNNIENNTNIEN